jgi:hypothetical protein
MSAATHVLTDQGVPIGWSIIADRPDLAYLADYDAARPATPAEMAVIEAAAYAEYRAFRVPRGPWPAATVPATAPEPAPEPGTLALLNGAYRAASGDEPAGDPPPVLGPAAERVAKDPARFLALHDAQDQREATAQIEAVGDATEVTPAVTEVTP